jgi:MFS family permease
VPFAICKALCNLVVGALADRYGRAVHAAPSRFAHSVPVYSDTLAAASSTAAWPDPSSRVPSQLNCTLIICVCATALRYGRKRIALLGWGIGLIAPTMVLSAATSPEGWAQVVASSAFLGMQQGRGVHSSISQLNVSRVFVTEMTERMPQKRSRQAEKWTSVSPCNKVWCGRA